MSLLDAVTRTGAYPAPDSVPPEKLQSVRKRYSEVLSKHLAWEVAAGLRAAGFSNIHPIEGGPGEREFQGGLGPKKVDVTHSDERNGLLLAVSIKSISTPPFGKNLKNRFADLCTEAITLHMRFPYSVVCALFAFPAAADEDHSRGRPVSTFRRAMKLLSTVSGRADYTGPGEKFEAVTMMLFRPASDPAGPTVRLFDAPSEREISETEYFSQLRDMFNMRNPHIAMEEGTVEDPSEE